MTAPTVADLLDTVTRLTRELRKDSKRLGKSARAAEKSGDYSDHDDDRFTTYEGHSDSLQVLVDKLAALTPALQAAGRLVDLAGQWDAASIVRNHREALDDFRHLLDGVRA